MTIIKIATKAFGKFIQSPELSMKFNYEKWSNKSKEFIFNSEIIDGKKVVTEEMNLDAGTIALQVAEKNKKLFAKARGQIQSIFGSEEGVTDVMNRPKSAVSSKDKIIKGIEDGKVTDWQSAFEHIGDGIGSRVIIESLPKLGNAEINKMIDELVVNGEKLTAKQKVLLKKYINNIGMSDKENIEAFGLFEKFAEPLIEKRTQPVVDKLCLAVAKAKLLKGELTIQQIKNKHLLNERLIKKLETEKIEPLEVIELNNYRGMFGLPEFTEQQMMQIENITGKIPIKNRVDVVNSAEWSKYYELSEKEIKALKKSDGIKDSGYRTFQMNVRHINGALGEVQFRGKYTNMIGEYEHLAYDLRRGKETISGFFNEYKKAVQGLTDKQYDEYNRYLEGCYNYYNRLELGLPTVKPLLPKGFKKILSEENMKRLHFEHEEMLAEAKKGFKQSYELVA